MLEGDTRAMLQREQDRLHHTYPVEFEIIWRVGQPIRSRHLEFDQRVGVRIWSS
jgi:hypothetical protein